jgi:hypothetical protein
MSDLLAQRHTIEFHAVGYLRRRNYMLNLQADPISSVY